MLNVGNENVPLCEGLSRRSFLRVGSAGLATLALPNLMRLEAANAIDKNRAKPRACRGGRSCGGSSCRLPPRRSWPG